MSPSTQPSLLDTLEPHFPGSGCRRPRFQRRRPTRSSTMS
uniref:Uncharacterized protein n=1 Tax=Rhizophora mucronata TaxID=61149 RepID=A0A2P2K4U6_RHIMU